MDAVQRADGPPLVPEEVPTTHETPPGVEQFLCKTAGTAAEKWAIW